MELRAVEFKPYHADAVVEVKPSVEDGLFYAVPEDTSRYGREGAKRYGTFVRQEGVPRELAQRINEQEAGALEECFPLGRELGSYKVKFGLATLWLVQGRAVEGIGITSRQFYEIPLPGEQ